MGSFVNRLKSLKLITTWAVIVLATILRCVKLIDGDQLVSILQIIIPAYFAGNVIAGHRAFRPIIPPTWKGSPEIDENKLK